MEAVLKNLKKGSKLGKFVEVKAYRAKMYSRNISKSSKRKNKNHKQKYWKKENKKVDKTNLIEIRGSRSELKEFLGKEIWVEGFITNTYGWDDTRRLLNSVRILGTPYYITHVWVRRENLAKARHGFAKLKAKIISYKDHITGADKYGIKITDERFRGKHHRDNKVKKPKWKKENKSYYVKLPI